MAVPPLRVIEDEFCWPSERMDQDDATNLLVGAAGLAALDHVLNGVGPLHVGHLPKAVLRIPGQMAGLNHILRLTIGIKIGGARTRRKSQLGAGSGGRPEAGASAR